MAVYSSPQLEPAAWVTDETQALKFSMLVWFSTGWILSRVAAVYFFSAVLQHTLIPCLV